MNQGERTWTQPLTPPTQLESVRLVEGVTRGQYWQVIPWPSTEPERGLDPRGVSAPLQTGQGWTCQSRQTRAPETHIGGFHAFTAIEIQHGRE